MEKKGVCEMATSLTEMLDKGSSITKIERYRWNTETGTPGVFRDIHKKDLLVDHTYQRSLSDSRVGALTRDWVWEAVGVLAVAQRENGQYYVMDGQHRLAAALRRADVSTLPCLVFTDANEAKLFIQLNTHRKPPTMLQTFRARVHAEDPVAVAIEDFLSVRGLFVPSCNRSRNPGAIYCIGVLYALWTRDQASTQTAMDICLQLTGGKAQITKDLLSGFAAAEYALRKQGASLEKRRARIMRIGLDEFRFSIKRSVIAEGAQTERAFRLGVVAAINKGLAPAQRIRVGGGEA